MASSHDEEHRVRVRAYHLWEAEGRPDGRESEFWHRAAELDHLESTAGQDSGAAPQVAPQLALQPEPGSASTASAKATHAKAPPAASAPKPKQPAEKAAAPKAAPRKRASAPVASAPKPNSARAKARPAEHP